MKTTASTLRKDMTALAGLICLMLVIALLLGVFYPPGLAGHKLANLHSLRANHLYVPE